MAVSETNLTLMLIIFISSVLLIYVFISYSYSILQDVCADYIDICTEASSGILDQQLLPHLSMHKYLIAILSLKLLYLVHILFDD